MISLSYRDLLLAILLIAVIILVIYLIALIKRLMPVVRNLTQVSEDAIEITKLAKKDMAQIDIVVTDAGSTATQLKKSLGSVCKLLDGNKNTVSAVTNLTNAIAGLANLLKKQ